MTAEVRPTHLAVTLLPGDEGARVLMEHVAAMERQISQLAEAVHGAPVMPIRPAVSVRVNVHALVEDAIERAIEYGCHRAYKHRDRSLPEGEVADIVREGTAASLRNIGAFLDLDAWEGT